MTNRSSVRARLQARKPASKRRRLKELLREEAQFRSVFESAPLGIFLTDAEGRPHECNPALERMLGYTADELRTMRITDFTHPDDGEETGRALQAIFDGKLERVQFEMRYIRKDGGLLWVNLVASTVLNTHGGVALSVAMIEDISDRKSAEADTATAISARESAEADTIVARDYAADLIETAGAMIVGLDLNGDIELFNKAAEEITGYTREELAGRNWFEVVVPQERYPAAREEFERLLAGGLPQEFENPILTKSGEERYIVWRGTELDNHGVTVGFVSIGIDITELKRAEETLRFRNALLSTQQEASIDGILIVDGDGRIISSNRRFAEMWGIPSDVLESGSDERALQSVMDKLKNPAEFLSKVKYLYEARNETSRDEIGLKDGRLFDRYSAPMFGPDEQYYGRVWYFRDVTDLKQTEEALRRERDLVAKIMDTSPTGIVALDAQGETIFANDGGEYIFGLTREELVGRKYGTASWHITDHEDRPIPDEELAYRRVLTTGQPVYDFHQTIANASGERIDVLVNAAPILDETGEVNGAIVSFSDISEHRRAEEARDLLESELLQSQKLEAVGRLAGGVAHNFNNVLTAIIGFSELLLARLPADSDLRSDVEEIQRAGARAAEVASRLLLFSRRRYSQRKRLDLNPVITEIKALLQQVIRSNIEIVTVLVDDLDLVESDRSQIEQVLVNLVVNSSDAMPDGGKLTIETANLHLAEPRVVRDLSLPAGNFVTLTIRDNGIGMNEETRARVFEPFFTTKGPDRGTGLGLSTVYGIVEDHEGSILVESAPGQGSTFTVFLPSIPDQRLSP